MFSLDKPALKLSSHPCAALDLVVHPIDTSYTNVVVVVIVIVDTITI